MFVQEEKIFAGKVLRLHICAADGSEWLEEATEDTSVEKLKESCLKHGAHGSLEDPKNVTHHKLIHAASERVLSDSKTILEENIQDQDVLLLIKKRAPSPIPKMADVSAEEKKKQEQKAPDKDAILRATANLPACTATSSSSSEAAVGTSVEDEESRDELTEIFKKIRRKKEFRADARAVISLMEMGFDEKEVIDALRVNNNQQNAACEWLLGDRKPSPEELDQGIDPNSPLFQAILDNPVVQLGLTNPKTLLAFEDMLENPLNSTQWMNDPETGPVMLQISRIFQTLNRT
ncbi:ubiquitin associated domain containing 1, isoform CRA_b [Rattus norvegicus]|uniref:Ubiquitin-associated domain-containing protein 1 n=1 Tax=Rattus norvegicus TaxID=10116 RepID=A6JTB8_RAT|nr:ubiquitin associated domain containing 1, isoform CRA_b [Rattus norvegicus]